MRITDLAPQERRPDRYNLSLDGHFAFALDGTLVVAEGLVPGMDLSPEQVEHLRMAEDERRLVESALRFLAPRPRSRAEVRRRLMRPRRDGAAPTPDAVQRVLDQLERQGYLNDREFADFWVENRERFSPRAARALGQELRQRGVKREIAAEVEDPSRDSERALAAARQRLRAVAGLDYAAFRQRLGGFLLRRGFSYGVANEAIRALWGEQHAAAPELSDDEAGAADW